MPTKQSQKVCTQAKPEPMVPSRGLRWSREIRRWLVVLGPYAAAAARDAGVAVREFVDSYGFFGYRAEPDGALAGSRESACGRSCLRSIVSKDALLGLYFWASGTASSTYSWWIRSGSFLLEMPVTRPLWTARSMAS